MKQSTPHTTLRLIRLSLHICLALALIMVKTATAAVKEGFNTTHIFGNNVVWPMTKWQKAAVSRPTNKKRTLNKLPFKLYRQQIENAFTIIMTPLNEQLDNWKNMYLIFGLKIPCTWNGNLTKAINELRPRSSNCQIAKYTQKTLQKNTHQAVMITEYCETNDPKKSGGIAVDYFALMPNNTYINVRQVWRDKSFKINDPSSWPVSKQDLTEAQANLRKIEIQPTEPPCASNIKKRTDLSPSLLSQMKQAMLDEQTKTLF